MASTRQVTPIYDAVDDQRRQALQRANLVRAQRVEIKRLIAAGQVTIADALFDERAEGEKIGQLLCAQRGWGAVKTHTLLNRLMIWPTRPVCRLTLRQRQLITEAVQSTTSTRNE